MIKNKKGQTTLEYAVLIAVIVGALVTMQIYMKRAAEGRLRSATDNIGEQFDPLATSGTWTYTSKSTSKEEVIQGLGGRETIVSSDDAEGNYSTKTGDETVEAW